LQRGNQLKKQNKFTVIFSENEEDFLKFKASAGDPNHSWFSQSIPLRTLRPLVYQDYEMQRDVFLCWNTDKRLPSNFKEFFKIPPFYDLHLVIYPSVTDTEVLDIAEKNDYLNPKNNIQMQMVK